MLLEMENSWPLTLSQQRILFLQKLSPKSTAYVDTIVLKTGNDVIGEEIISRMLKIHPILSTKIWKDETSGEYRQRCDDNRLEEKIQKEKVPVSTLLQSYISDTIPVFDVTNCRLTSFRCIEDGADIVIAAHIHQILSCILPLDKFHTILENILHRSDEINSVSSVSISQHVTQEIHYLDSTVYEMDKTFWMKTFSDAPSDAVISLHHLNEQNDLEIHDAKALVKQLRTSEIVSFPKHSNELDVSKFHYFLSCLTIVLQRYLGTEDVTIAVKHAQRYTLFPFRVNVQQNFENHAINVSQSWRETQLHSNFPFLHLSDILWSLHAKSIDSFCIIELEFQEAEKSMHSLVCAPIHARVPLRMQINTNCETDETSIQLEWADKYVDDGIAERFLDSYLNLCLLKPDRKIKDISYLSSKESALLNMFGELSSVTADEKYSPIHSSFEDYVAQEEESIAVIVEDKCFTYKEIDEISNDLADIFTEHTDAFTIRERPIVLLMEKDHLAVAAILAVWKIGGYFLPLSTTHKTTLKELIESQATSLIIHNVDIPEDLGNMISTKAIKTIDVRKPFPPRNGESTERQLSPDLMLSDVAYAIRTSGSTGRPKLCKISHKSLNILSRAWINACGLSQGARILQWAPLSFDVFIGDLVRALIAVQGTLVICPDDRRLDIPYIHSLINGHKVTNVEFTPQFALRVVESASSEILDSLRSIVIGSDVTHQNLFHNIQSKLRSGQRFVHGYGMTEATIDSIYFESKEIPKTRSGTVPIGKPLPGVGALILDPTTGLRCPIGTIGELYLYGDIIASGDVVCEEVKIDDHTATRALRTKDQCCWLPSGDIELYGRLDDVVKIRGFRVSLTEIENKILSCVKTAKEVCVLVIRDQAVHRDKDFLVAYVVSKPNDAAVDRDMICKALEGELPYYMIPDAVCPMPSIPMTLNGKINRKALPSLKEILQRSNSDNTTAVRADNEDTYSEIQKLFAEALGLDEYRKISRTDTFMNQGGHSLVLLSFHGLILQRTTYQITIKDILQHPTISMLEDYLKTL